VACRGGGAVSFCPVVYYVCDGQECGVKRATGCLVSVCDFGWLYARPNEEVRRGYSLEAHCIKAWLMVAERVASSAEKRSVFRQRSITPGFGGMRFAFPPYSPCPSRTYAQPAGSARRACIGTGGSRSAADRAEAAEGGDQKSETAGLRR
jgi:hypothetical protein